MYTIIRIKIMCCVLFYNHNFIEHNTSVITNKSIYIYIYIYIYIQDVSGGIVNILEGSSMDYFEQINSYKHASSFQWVWRYSCLNVTH